MRDLSKFIGLTSEEVLELLIKETEEAQNVRTNVRM
jgi:hypothetical protein